MHMYGEVLVKHLFKKGAISELPICYLPPMNQIIIDNNINWDYEGMTGSEWKPWTLVLIQDHIMSTKKENCGKLKQIAIIFNLF